MSARGRGGATTYYMHDLSIFVREICIFDITLLTLSLWF